ncbi:MAG TPA: DUF72 domain-containing protein [Longimicrobiaceae bacterium]|nr:DUF72 domain-containing protein [Longimicrobiaceae bacterium]
MQANFPAEGSHLARYAARFPAVEINSSFYRPHRPTTWARWADETPPDFRFSAKLPKTITHQLRLAGADEALDAFLSQAHAMGEKLAVLLVQLPPSLAFDAAVAPPFLARLRASTGVAIACEPRHPSWFEPEVDALLAELGVARVAADPACVPAAAEPGGAREVVYYRLHGSPRVYYSAYSPEYVRALAGRLAREAAAGREAWCIFDNTALGEAWRNGLELLARLESP